MQHPRAAKSAHLEGTGRSEPHEDVVLDAGAARPLQSARMDALLYTGLVALLISSTLNGLSLELAFSGTDLTIRPDQLVLAWVAPLLLLAWVRRWFQIRMVLLDWLVAGFVLSNAVASFVFSPTPAASVKGTLLVGAYAAMYFIARSVVANRREWVRRAANWVLVLGVAQAAYSIVAVILYSWGVAIGGLQFGHLTSTSVATRGTFWEANLLGAYLALITVLLAARYVFRSTAGHSRQYLAGVIISGLAVPLTMTRAAGLALGLGALAVVATAMIPSHDTIDEWKRRTVALAAALGCVALLAATAMNALVSEVSADPNLLLRRWTPASWIPENGEAAVAPDASSPGGRARANRGGFGTRPRTPLVEGQIERMSESSVDGRLDAWRLAVQEWRKSPVLGYGTVSGTGIVKDGWWYSSLVQALHDTGVVGFLLLLSIHIGAVMYPVRAWYHARHLPASEDLLALGLGNAVLVFTSQFSSFFFVGFPWVLLGVAIGAVVAYSRTLAESASRGPIPAT